MPSPLPGMDPYIEQSTVWSDLHSRVAALISAELNAQVRPRYVARLTPYVTYDHIEVGMLLEVPLELLSIEIRTVADMVLVTAIEILSPVNKRRGHDAYHDYLRKRRDLLRSAAHLIEVDLLRAGERPPLEAPVQAAPYYVMVSRADRRPSVQVWPIQLWDRLPTIPVPLREPDPDATIDLAASLVAAYDDGGYDLLIDYDQPPPSPELSSAETGWLDEHLRGCGAR